MNFGFLKYMLMIPWHFSEMVTNLYFFFEPGLCYYISFSNIFPIIVVLLKYNEEKMQTELGENDKYCDYGYN